MKKKKILIWGYYGANNFGDDLIFNVLFENLQSLKDEYEFWYSVKDPESSYRNIDATPIQFFNRKSSFKPLNFLLNIIQLFSTILKMDAVIIGGGTQFFEIDGRKNISILLKNIACKICKIRGKAFITAGVGVGNVTSKRGMKNIAQLFNKATYSFVRDQNSYDRLIELGVKPNKVTLGKDLSYYSKKVLDFIPSNESIETKCIGINVFDYYNYIEKSAEKNQAFRKALTSFLSHLENEGYTIHLFALQKGSGGRDFEFMKEISTGIKHKFHYYKDDINHFMNMVGKMDINIGMRYHLAVISLQFGVPTIGVNYQPKVRREFKLFNIEEFVLEMDDILKGNILGMFNNMTAQKNIIQTKVQGELNKIIAGIDQNTIKKITQIITNGVK